MRTRSNARSSPKSTATPSRRPWRDVEHHELRAQGQATDGHADSFDLGAYRGRWRRPITRCAPCAAASLQRDAAATGSFSVAPQRARAGSTTCRKHATDGLDRLTRTKQAARRKGRPGRAITAISSSTSNGFVTTSSMPARRSLAVARHRVRRQATMAPRYPGSSRSNSVARRPSSTGICMSINDQVERSAGALERPARLPRLSVRLIASSDDST